MATDAIIFVPPTFASIRQSSPLLTDIEVLVLDPKYGTDQGMTPHSAYAGMHQPNEYQARTRRFVSLICPSFERVKLAPTANV